jgi:hypothetical protein
VGSGLVAVDARGVVGFGDVVDAIDALGSQRRVDRDREETRAKEEDEVKGMHSLSTATKAPDLVPRRGLLFYKERSILVHISQRLGHVTPEVS